MAKLIGAFGIGDGDDETVLQKSPVPVVVGLNHVFLEEMRERGGRNTSKCLSRLLK